MKIALVNRHPDDVIGGSELQSDGIATRLTKMGHEIIYVAPAGKTDKNYNRPYKVIPVESDANTIGRVVLDQKPEIVYWRFNKYHFHDAVKMVAKNNIPVIFAVSHISDTKPWSCRENMASGLIPFLKGIKQGLLNLYNHLGFKYVSGVTVNNPDHLNLLPIQRQCFIPNSVPDKVVPFSWTRPFVVWVSNIKPAKRPELFIKLAKECSDQEIDFLMVGGIQDDNYQWIKDENENTPQFHYLGSKSPEEVNGIIKESLFFVHTCKPEGFPGVFIQSWLQKKPTITYEFDPGSFIADNELGGVAKENWTAFVNLTKNLIKDDGKRQDTGDRAYHFADSLFAPDNTIKTLEQFLQTFEKE